MTHDEKKKLQALRGAFTLLLQFIFCPDRTDGDCKGCTNYVTCKVPTDFEQYCQDMGDITELRRSWPIRSDTLKLDWFGISGTSALDVLEKLVNGVARNEITIPKPSDVAAGLMIHNQWEKLLQQLNQEEALHVQADIASGKAEDTATPDTDPNLIYQADAAEFYNIPKATLSKAANKKAGEAGYLWSGRRGKRVFYRKADIEKLSRSRAKLSK